MMHEEKKGRSWVVWAVIVVIIALAAILIFWQGPATESTIGTEDNTSAIAEQLDSIDLGSLDAELMDINEELEQL